MPRGVVHIGTHKTGTSSFQGWGDDNRAEVQRLTGFRFFESSYAVNAFEIPILAVRQELDLHSVFRDGSNWVTPEIQREMRAHIRSQLDGQDLIISAEGLAFIRTAEEVDTLRELLDPYELDFIVVQREPGDFLRSYTQWMKKSNIMPSNDPASCRYVGTGSWILYFDRFPKLFPGIKIIDYRKAMNDSGSIIPAIMETIGADPSALPGWSDYKLNPGMTTKQVMVRNLKRRLRALRKRKS